MENNLVPKDSSLPIQYLTLIQLAEDEMNMLYNCPDSKTMVGKGYYYDVMEEFNKCWKRLSRTMPKGEGDKYRDTFCDTADEASAQIDKIREFFIEKCAERFEGPTELLAHLITAKFILKSANHVFREMYGMNVNSKIVSDIMSVMDRYASKFRIKAKSEDLTIAADINLVSEFSDILNTIAAKV